MMKKDAVLVNAARGPVIDEVAVVNHLRANPEFRYVHLQHLQYLFQALRDRLRGSGAILTSIALLSATNALQNLLFAS